MHHADTIGPTTALDELDEDLEAELAEVPGLADHRTEKTENDAARPGDDDFLWDYNPSRQRLHLSLQTYKCDCCAEADKECVSDFLPQGDQICKQCRWRRRADFEKIAQSKVADEYGLSLVDLKEACRTSPEYPHGRLTIERKAHKNVHLQEMKLYYRFQLERLCQAKHGSVQNWREKRDSRHRARYQTILERANLIDLEPKSKAPRIQPSQCQHE